MNASLSYLHNIIHNQYNIPQSYYRLRLFVLAYELARITCDRLWQKGQLDSREVNFGLMELAIKLIPYTFKCTLMYDWSYHNIIIITSNFVSKKVLLDSQFFYISERKTITAHDLITCKLTDYINKLMWLAEVYSAHWKIIYILSQRDKY